MSRMLSPAPDGVYRGLDPALGTNGALSTTQRPNTSGLRGVAAGRFVTRYIFDDKSRFPP